jgi:hypothetical protein
MNQPNSMYGVDGQVGAITDIAPGNARDPQKQGVRKGVLSAAFKPP